jgi:heat shock protein HslJ/membrane-bound inhibitor of C-type lysozyme
MLRCLLAVLALASVTPAGARDITGQMTYPERIALPQGGQLAIALKGPGGVPVAEARIETEGRQVPLPFTLIAPDAQAYTLEAVVFVAGRPEWRSGPMMVAGGEGALDLGEIRMRRATSLGFPVTFDCGGTPVQVGYAETRARLRLGAEVFDLEPAPTASGARYSDGETPETAVWSKGNAALVTLRGKELPECQPVITQPLLPLAVRGNEPGWVLRLSEDGFEYEGDMGTRRFTGPLPDAQPTGSGARLDLAPELGLTLDQTLCRDTMTGMPHPISAQLTDGARQLSGCAGQPGSLLEGQWKVTGVEGQPVPEGIVADMTFDLAESRVFGSSGCNRFSGGFTLTGEGLRFGPAAGTMMACPETQMTVEQAFLRSLTTVDRFDITVEGDLMLYVGPTVVIRAGR